MTGTNVVNCGKKQKRFCNLSTSLEIFATNVFKSYSMING